MTGYVALTVPAGLGESMFLVVYVGTSVTGALAVVTMARCDTRAKAETLAGVYNERASNV